MFRRCFQRFLALAIALAMFPAALAQHVPGKLAEYTILSAQYGTERRHVDVTRKLQVEARRDRMFRVRNEAFGVDPDRGVAKVLRIYARGPQGREHMFEFPEGAVVDGAQFRDWERGEWASGADRWSGKWNPDEGEYTILSARYGTERKHVDVTERLKSLARKDRMFRMGNDSFGVDPDLGRVKTLRIFARGNDGQERMFEFREGAIVDGGQFRGWSRGDWGLGEERRREKWDTDEGEYTILSAQYGTERKHVDVTERLKGLARRDRLFRMGNDTFGVDPDVGRVKTLRIYARGSNGRERVFEYREGSLVDGNQFRGWGRGEFGQGKERWHGRWEGER